MNLIVAIECTGNRTRRQSRDLRDVCRKARCTPRIKPSKKQRDLQGGQAQSLALAITPPMMDSSILFWCSLKHRYNTRQSAAARVYVFDIEGNDSRIRINARTLERHNGLRTKVY